MKEVTQIEQDWKSIHTKPTYINHALKAVFYSFGKDRLTWTEYMSANSENTSPSCHPWLHMRTWTQN